MLAFILGSALVVLLMVYSVNRKHDAEVIKHDELCKHAPRIVLGERKCNVSVEHAA